MTALLVILSALLVIVGGFAENQLVAADAVPAALRKRLGDSPVHHNEFDAARRASAD